VTISTADFSFVADMVRQRSAIDLQPGKEYLVEARLTPVAMTSGVTSLGALVGRLRRGDTQLLDAVVDALTTNETLWFRDAVPFQVFTRYLLPEVAQRSTDRKLVIWSAACSSGQEAYSLAMLLLDWLPANPGFEARVVGTDISRQMVERARAGLYSQLEVDRGAEPYLYRYFQPSGRDWLLRSQVRDMATFGWGNLSLPPVGVPPCDIVFLRNVLIYFDVPTKRRVIEHARSVLRPGGFLVLGGAESVPSLGPDWQRRDLDRTVVFQNSGGTP
jgi:chemotaxis protein methyltransferase CheR